jgi:hypothetical protein
LAHEYAGSLGHACLGGSCGIVVEVRCSQA